jgi:hypothetical protein
MGVKLGLSHKGEPHRFMAFGNRVLKRIFGPNREEVTRYWRRLHNEELHNLYASPNIIRSRRMRLARHVARVREMRNAYNILIGKSQGKRPLGR